MQDKATGIDESIIATKKRAMLLLDVGIADAELPAALELLARNWRA